MSTTTGKASISLSHLQTQRVDWLWPGWIAAGTIALLDGDPGQGKSLLTLDLAARLSTASPMPDGHVLSRPASVILLTSEDSVASTVVPRLQAAGADLSRLHAFQPDSARPPSFPDDCELLAQMIRETAARLVVIDPFLAFLSTGAYCLNDQLVRQALTPLAQVAEKTGAALLLVRHLTKTEASRRALQRGIGAMAVIGVARTAFLAAALPDDAEQRALACTKSNLGVLPATLAYRIGQNAAGIARIEWTGPIELASDELLGSTGRERGDAIDEAVAFLQELLARGPVSRESVFRQAHGVGIAERTLKRAKQTLGVVSRQRFEDGRNLWYWSLAGDGRTALP